MPVSGRPTVPTPVVIIIPALTMHLAVCQELDALAAHLWRVAPRRAPAHELILKHARARSPGGFRREWGGRLGSWANTSRLFHLTHIAKTGGRSVRVEMLRLVRPVGGAEQCYPPFAHESRVNVLFLREPRSHVLSQYLHGAYAGRTARRRAAGYPIGENGDVTDGLRRWIAHFADGWTPQKGDFYSYNPLNMMARTYAAIRPRLLPRAISPRQRAAPHGAPQAYVPRHAMELRLRVVVRDAVRTPRRVSARRSPAPPAASSQRALAFCPGRPPPTRRRPSATRSRQCTPLTSWACWSCCRRRCACSSTGSDASCRSTAAAAAAAPRRRAARTCATASGSGRCAR